MNRLLFKLTNRYETVLDRILYGNAKGFDGVEARIEQEAIGWLKRRGADYEAGRGI